MIKEAYCSFEVARLLKEKGYNEYSYVFYSSEDGVMYREKDIPCKNEDSDDFAAPTHQMVMAWLREEKHISIIIEFDVTKRGYCPYVYAKDYDCDWVCVWRVNMPMKYEEAVEAALKYTLENLI